MNWAIMTSFSKPHGFLHSFIIQSMSHISFLTVRLIFWLLCLHVFPLFLFTSSCVTTAIFIASLSRISATDFASADRVRLGVSTAPVVVIPGIFPSFPSPLPLHRAQSRPTFVLPSTDCGLLFIVCVLLPQSFK